MKSKIHERHPNSKFCKGSRAYEKRREILARIVERMKAGKSFSDLQTGVPA